MITPSSRFTTDTPTNGNGHAASRTERQRQASRENGRRSQGPKSPEGKARSRMNATKHGLLVKRIIPHADYRDDDRLYRDVRKELLREFAPTTFTAHATVDALAGDYVRAAHARAMVETMLRPSLLNKHDDQLWHTLQRVRRELPVLERAQTVLDGDEPPALPKRDAQRVASIVVELLTSIENDLAEQVAAEAEYVAAQGIVVSPDAEEMSADDSATDEQLTEEDRRLDELLDALGETGRRRLSDRDYLTGILTGGKPKRGDLKRLGTVIAYINDSHKRWIDTHANELENKAKDLVDVRMYQLAKAPERLELLHRYLQQIERAIEEKIARLSG